MWYDWYAECAVQGTGRSEGMSEVSRFELWFAIAVSPVAVSIVLAILITILQLRYEAKQDIERPRRFSQAERY